MKSPVAQGSYPTHTPLTAGSMPNLPSMASGKQDVPSHPLPQSTVKHQPVPYPRFSNKYKEYLPPKPTKRNVSFCHQFMAGYL